MKYSDVLFNDSLLIEISNRIVEERKKRNLDQFDLVELLNETHKSYTGKSKGIISRNTLSQLESGIAEKVRNVLDIDILLALCDLFGWDLGFLYGFYNEKTFEKHQIHEYTGLSEESIDYLIKCVDDGLDTDPINYLLGTPSDLWGSIAAHINNAVSSMIVYKLRGDPPNSVYFSATIQKWKALHESGDENDSSAISLPPSEAIDFYKKETLESFSKFLNEYVSVASERIITALNKDAPNSMKEGR